MPGDYNFQIKGELFDHLSATTGLVETVDFNVIVFELIASTTVDQVYLLEGTAETY